MTDALETAGGAEDAWLFGFHEGHRATLERCYREHHGLVTLAVAKVLDGADRETITHEVFYRLLTRRELRENFRGGNLGAWLARVATNLAIDHRRRARREELVPQADEAAMDALRAARELDEEAVAKRIVERFRAEKLPAKWQAVFEARFLRQLGQYEAAEALGIPRSTLVYQEQKIRELLRAFVLDEDDDDDAPRGEVR